MVLYTPNTPPLKNSQKFPKKISQIKTSPPDSHKKNREIDHENLDNDYQRETRVPIENWLDRSRTSFSALHLPFNYTQSGMFAFQNQSITQRLAATSCLPTNSSFNSTQNSKLNLTRLDWNNNEKIKEPVALYLFICGRGRAVAASTISSTITRGVKKKIRKRKRKEIKVYKKNSNEAVPLNLENLGEIFSSGGCCGVDSHQNPPAIVWLIYCITFESIVFGTKPVSTTLALSLRWSYCLWLSTRCPVPHKLYPHWILSFVRISQSNWQLVQ